MNPNLTPALREALAATRTKIVQRPALDASGRCTKSGRIPAKCACQTHAPRR